MRNVCNERFAFVAGLGPHCPYVSDIHSCSGDGRVRHRCRVPRHRGVQLILAYSWARSAILAAGKGREEMFLFLLFLHFHSFSFLPCPSL